MKSEPLLFPSSGLVHPVGIVTKSGALLRTGASNPGFVSRFVSALIRVAKHVATRASLVRAVIIFRSEHRPQHGAAFAQPNSEREGEPPPRLSTKLRGTVLLPAPGKAIEDMEIGGGLIKSSVTLDGYDRHFSRKRHILAATLAEGGRVRPGAGGSAGLPGPSPSGSKLLTQ